MRKMLRSLVAAFAIPQKSHFWGCFVNSEILGQKFCFTSLQRSSGGHPIYNGASNSPANPLSDPLQSVTMTNQDTQPENQPFDCKLVKLEHKQADYIPFEIVREETKHIAVKPSSWQLVIISVIGILALIVIATAGLFVVIIGMLIAIPVVILRGLLSTFFRK